MRLVSVDWVSQRGAMPPSSSCSRASSTSSNKASNVAIIWLIWHQYKKGRKAVTQARNKAALDVEGEGHQNQKTHQIRRCKQIRRRASSYTGQGFAQRSESQCLFSSSLRPAGSPRHAGFPLTSSQVVITHYQTGISLHQCTVSEEFLSTGPFGTPNQAKHMGVGGHRVAAFRVFRGRELRLLHLRSALV